MKHAVIVVALGLLLCTVSGCGGSPADNLMQSQIKTMNELADALEAKAPEAKMKELEGKMKDFEKQFKELKLSEDEQKKLMEKHKDAMMKATARLMGAALKGTGLPGMGGKDEKDKDK